MLPKLFNYLDLNVVTSDLKEENFTGKGNIIEGKNLSGENSEGNIIELTNCHLISYHANLWNQTENGFLFEGDFIADKFTITYKLFDKDLYKRLFIFCRLLDP